MPNFDGGFDAATSASRTPEPGQVRVRPRRNANAPIAVTAPADDVRGSDRVALQAAAAEEAAGAEASACCRAGSAGARQPQPLRPRLSRHRRLRMNDAFKSRR